MAAHTQSEMDTACNNLNHGETPADHDARLTDDIVDVLRRLSAPKLHDVLAGVLKLHKDGAELLVKALILSLKPDVKESKNIMNCLRSAYTDVKQLDADAKQELLRAHELHTLLERLRTRHETQEVKLQAVRDSVARLSLEVSHSQEKERQLMADKAEVQASMATTRRVLDDSRSRLKVERQRAREIDTACCKERERIVQLSDGLVQAAQARASLEARIAMVHMENHKMEAAAHDLTRQHSELCCRVDNVSRQVTETQHDLECARARLRNATLGATFLSHVAIA
jgi:chromosome segregation ATPase